MNVEKSGVMKMSEKFEDEINEIKTQLGLMKSRQADIDRNLDRITEKLKYIEDHMVIQ